MRNLQINGETFVSCVDLHEWIRAQGSRVWRRPHDASEKKEISEWFIAVAETARDIASLIDDWHRDPKRKSGAPDLQVDPMLLEDEDTETPKLWAGYDETT